MIAVELCAPERKPVELEAAEVIVPGADGLFTVKQGHTPFLTTLQPGVLVIANNQGEEKCYAVSGGFAEVRTDRLVILADAFEKGDEIDELRAEEARKRAEERLVKHDADIDVERAERALSRSLSRIGAHKKKYF